MVRSVLGPSYKYVEIGGQVFLPEIICSSEAPFHLTQAPKALGTLLLAKLKVRPLIHSEREVGMAAV